MKHTPGPWTISEDPIYDVLYKGDTPSITYGAIKKIHGLVGIGIWNEGYTQLIVCVPWGGLCGVPKEEAEANAALIAKLPEMVKDIEAYMRFW